MSEFIANAVTLPFRVIDLQAFARHLDQFVGLSYRVLDMPSGKVILDGDHDSWDISKLDAQGQVIEENVDLDEIVRDHLQPGEIAVFQWIQSVRDEIHGGVYAVNSIGESHQDTLEDLTARALAILGAAEEDSPEVILKQQENGDG